MNDLFAQRFDVFYRWPDDPKHRWSSGIIIYTNIPEIYNDEEGESVPAVLCGTTDESVLIYTDSMDHKYVRMNFDGLEFRTEWVGMKRYYPEGLTSKEFFKKYSWRYSNDKRR